jgi:hypothetical protein
MAKAAAFIQLFISTEKHCRVTLRAAQRDVPKVSFIAKRQRSRRRRASISLFDWSVLPALHSQGRTEADMMKLPLRHFLHPAAFVAAVLFAPTGDSAWSQTAKPVKVIMPYPPGGGGDILAR